MKPRADQRFHRLPAGAGGVEDQHLVAGVLEHLARPGDAGRGDAEHGGGDERPVPGDDRRRFGADHAGNGAGGIGDDARREAIDAGNVDDRGHHRHVGDADIGADVARGERRQHELGDADRAAPASRRCRSRCRRRRPSTTMPSMRPSRWSRATTSAAPRAIAAIASPRSFPARSAARSAPPARATSSAAMSGANSRRAEDADVDHQRRDARRLDPRLEIGELDALGVERTDDGNDLLHFPPLPRIHFVSSVGRQRLAQSGTRRHVLDTGWIRMDRDPEVSG